MNKKWKRGDIHPKTGLFYWDYRKNLKNPEIWLTKKSFIKYKIAKKRIDLKYHTTSKKYKKYTKSNRYRKYMREYMSNPKWKNYLKNWRKNNKTKIREYEKRRKIRK